MFNQNTHQSNYHPSPQQVNLNHVHTHYTALLRTNLFHLYLEIIYLSNPSL